MFDTHCHLQTEAFAQDLDQVLQESRAQGVTRFLIPAIDLASFDRTLEVASSAADIACALGIHPHAAKEWDRNVRARIVDAVGKDPNIKAIGEIGIDYYYDFAPKEVQQRAFREQIQLARSVGLPIIVHTRDSEEDVLRIVEEEYEDASPEEHNGQFHCFAGGLDMMERALAKGFYVSFTGNITFKKSTLTEVVERTPLERILIETDSPYLTPAPHRGKRNTPAFLPLVASKIAEIKQLPVQQVMKQTFENSLRLFKLAPLVLVLALLGLMSMSTEAQSQPRSNPVGSRPPDSVMTPERRAQEELLKKQREELAREQEQRRLDSVQQVQREQLEMQMEAVAQMRKDSLRAAEKLAEAEAAALKAATPMPWKAIGIGGGVGIGNMAMIQAKATITPTSVLATGLQIGGHLSRVVDLELGFYNMRVGSDLMADSLYSAGPSFPVSLRPVGQRLDPGHFVPIEENLDISWWSLDSRFVLNPHTSFKFYLGIGYTHLTMTNTQRAQTIKDTMTRFEFLPSDVTTREESFSRGSIKLLFGIRYDIELSSQFTLTPFAQISALGAFSGDAQKQGLVFNPDPDQITMTHLNVGATLYFGWFGVPRQ